MSATDIVKASRVFETTESGLHVPGHVLEEKRDAERKTVRWTQDKWKRLRRCFAECASEKLLLLPTCAECKQLVSIVSLDPGVAINPDDRLGPNKFALRCHCTDRVIVKGGV